MIDWSGSLVLFFVTGFLPAQTASQMSGPAAWEIQDSGVTASLRGISVVDRQIVWVSGSGGTYGVTTDGGKNWRAAQVPGAESLDFRDVEATDAENALLLSAGPGDNSRIYRTTDAGETWQILYTNPHPEGFFNAMAFWDDGAGIAVSDPVDGRLLIVVTEDRTSWTPLAAESRPEVAEGEYGFAASGSNIAVQPDGLVWIGTGGSKARVFRSANRGKSWEVASTPLPSGAPSKGIFSLAFRDSLHGIAVGGDYQNASATGGNAALSNDGGRTWTLLAHPDTLSYRSCVVWVGRPTGPALVAVGSGGAGFSADGDRWTSFGSQGYHTLGSVGGIVWAAGSQGRIARLTRFSPR